jgi:hypothetical protein
MARHQESIYFKPDEVIEVLDMLKEMYNQEESIHIPIELFAKMYREFSDLKERVHLCKECNTRWFSCFMNKKKDYIRTCDDCEVDEE